MSQPLAPLVRTGLWITTTGAFSILSIRWYLQSYIRGSVTYKEAMGLLRENKNALEVLGEPVKEKRVDVGDDKCWGRRDNVRWVSVPLVGKQRKGYLHYWVTIDDPKAEKFHLSKVEFEVEGSEGNRITLKNEENFVAPA